MSSALRKTIVIRVDCDHRVARRAQREGKKKRVLINPKEGNFVSYEKVRDLIENELPGMMVGMG